MITNELEQKEEVMQYLLFYVLLHLNEYKANERNSNFTKLHFYLTYDVFVVISLAKPNNEMNYSMNSNN